MVAAIIPREDARPTLTCVGASAPERSTELHVAGDDVNIETPTSSTTQRAHLVPLDPNAVLDVLGAGVVVVDADDGIISKANPQAARILRRAVNEIEGSPIAHVIAPMTQLLEGRREDSRGEVFILVDRAKVALGYSINTATDPRSGASQHVLLFQEITSIHELRKQRDRLLQIAVIGEVMPTLLHEIRNPLAAVTAMLEVLLEDAPIELRGDLHAILCEVRRMALGLQGIGGLVRTMHSSTHCAVDLAIRETCRLLEHSAVRRNVELQAIGPDLPLLPIDRGAVCGVVFNLVKNAIDACPNGGHVWVNAYVEQRGGTEQLVVVVTDDGVGMGADVIAHCRELFFTTKDTGSGVGLALCSQVAEASGGGLSIESHVGVGTRVTLRVPKHPTNVSRSSE